MQLLSKMGLQMNKAQSEAQLSPSQGQNTVTLSKMDSTLQISSRDIVRDCCDSNQLSHHIQDLTN